MFGGYNSSGFQIDTVQYLDMETNAFSGAITTTGAALPAAASPGAAVVGSLIYIFGGVASGAAYPSDMYTFNPDPTSYAVTQITQSGDVPSGRSAMSFLTYGSKIVLFGG